MKSATTLRETVRRIVGCTPVIDIHTHLYDPALRSLLLWGLDELLVYHYLVAEAFRVHPLPSREFWALTRERQAELIWEELFVRRTPVSEACRGVVTTLNRLGLDVRRRDLARLRRWFAEQDPQRHVDRVLELAGIERVYMTNSPFDDEERRFWEGGFRRDPRFYAALRIDPLLVDWPAARKRLAGWGYVVREAINARSADGVRRFLGDWVKRIDAQYLMVSLPPEFGYPAPHDSARMLEQAVLPFCREAGLALALMLGVRRGVNPELRLAGDGVGRSELTALANLCAGHPDNRFVVTVLSRENQHELCVLARKFRNLHIFGCWWFNNVPHLIDEITRLRLELVGLSCTPQHSDARVLDQLIYKWGHFRPQLAEVLAEKYAEVKGAGWPIRAEAIQRDVRELLGGGFVRFCGQSNLDATGGAS